MTSAGSLRDTRASGTAGVAEMAWIMATAASKPIMPCCRSTVTLSKPWWPITSAE